MSRRVTVAHPTDAESDPRRHADGGTHRARRSGRLTTDGWQRWIRVRATNRLSRYSPACLEPAVSLTGRVAVRVVGEMSPT
jgi:hypothetical protein